MRRSPLPGRPRAGQANVASTHPAVARASPFLCEVRRGDALFLPRGWHHAVISTSRGARRNLAVNLWYAASASGQGQGLSALADMFQQEGCGAGAEGGAAGGGGKEEL